MFEIREDDLSGAAVRGLLTLHLAGMRADSPPGQSFALDLSALRAPEVTVWTAWTPAGLAGVGALKALGERAGEVKSMRTHPSCLRQGVGAALLNHIVGEAKRRGYRRLSLETGRGEAFEPALTLYRTRGFVDGEAFADYAPNGFSRYLHLDL